MCRSFLWLSSFVVCVLCLNDASFAGSSRPIPDSQKAAQTLNDLPLVFEPNLGQANSDVRFTAHGRGLKAKWKADSAEIFLPGDPGQANRLVLSWGANGDAIVAGENLLPGRTSYFRGNDPARWHAGIENYARIRYAQVYPGIDLAFYGNGEHLEHDFIVAPGARADRIEFSLQGAQSLKLNKAGDLVVQMAGGTLKFRRPFAYQESGGNRIPVAARFLLKGSQVAFKLGRYDRSRTLTIDPVLSFSTFLAGTGFDQINGVAVDASGNIYVTGATNSADFPTASPLQPGCTDCAVFPNRTDAFIAKLNPTGNALLYSTFLGGRLADTGNSIAVDSTGNAIIGGNTMSPDFPAVNPIGSVSCCSNQHLFMASLSPSGAALNYSGIIGPLSAASVFGAPQVSGSVVALVAVDAAGNAYVTAQTLFAAFPTTPGTIAAVPAASPSPTLVALKISPTGGLTWSTAIPGNSGPGPLPPPGSPGPNTFFHRSISVDASGNVFIAGTGTAGLPATAGVIGPSFTPDTTAAGTTQGFALKLNATASALVYATYLPTTREVRDAAVDTSGNAYIGGTIFSTALPVSANALFKTMGCTFCSTGYLLRLNSTASAISLATYWPALVDHLTLDGSADVYVTGTGTLAEKNPLLFNPGGFTSVSELSPDFSTLLFSSSLSPSFSGGPAMALTPSGKIVLAGITQGIPTTPGAFQPSQTSGPIDALRKPMISAIDPGAAGPAICGLPALLVFNAAGSLTAPLQNCGNGDLHVTSVTSDSPRYSAVSSCPAALTPGASCSISVTFSPLDPSFQSGNILVRDDAPSAQQVIQVFGPGRASPLNALPALVTFFDTLTGSTLVKKAAVKAINGSAQNMTLSNIVASGDFHVAPNACPFTLVPPGPFQAGECDIDISFSPTATGLRTGTLSLVDSVSGATHTVPLQGNGTLTQPAPVPIGTTYPSSGGPPLLFLGDNFTANSVVTVDGLVRSSQFVAPTTLDLSHSSLLLSDFNSIGELPASVTTPVPGGGTAASQITIYSAATSTSFDNLTFPVTPADLVYDPNAKLLYASMQRPLLVGTISSEVMAIDPVTRKAVKGFDLGHAAAGALAVSDDGQFVYAGLNDINAVAQITAATGTVNFVAPLGADPDFGPYVANAIRVLPGKPHSWVVSLAPANQAAIFSALAVKVFDDSTARPAAVLNGYALGVFPGAITFAGSNAATLYSSDPTQSDNSLYRFTIGPSGITLLDKTPNLGGADIDSDGVSLYLANGSILDPVTLASKGSFSLGPTPPRRVKADGAASRVFFIGDSTRIAAAGFAGGSIQAFDTNTHAPVGSLEVPEAGIDHLARWGTNGLAFVDTKSSNRDFPSELEITRSHLTGTPAPIQAFRVGNGPNADSVPTLTVKAGTPGAYTLTAVPTNGFTGQINFSCGSLPAFSTCSFNPTSLTIGPASGSLTVTILTNQATSASVRPPDVRGVPFITLASMLAAPLALVLAGRRRRVIVAIIVLLILAIAGCGGGGGTPGPPPPPNVTPPGSYTVVLTATGAGATRQTTLPLVVQ